MAIVNSTRSGKIDNRLMESQKRTGASEAVRRTAGSSYRRLYHRSHVRSDRNERPGTEMPDPSVGPNSNGMEAPIKDETSRARVSRMGGVQVYRVNEAGTSTPKKPKICETPHESSKSSWVSVTTRYALDVTLMESFVKQAYSEEMGFVLDDEIVRGTGAGQCPAS